MMSAPSVWKSWRCAGAVEADLGSGSLDPLVADVAEQRAGRVLADGCAEVQAEREVGELGLGVVEEVDREAAQEHEPAARRRGV